MNVYHECVPNHPPPPPPNLSCDSKYYTGPCPPTDPNALTKCISAALVASDNKGVLGCATILRDIPENSVTKCISAGLLANDNIAVLKCAKLLPSINGASNNLTNTTTAPTPQHNVTAAIQPGNTSIPVSGKPGKGTTCTAGNCTGGPQNQVNCNTNPNDPACTQTLQPLTPPAPSTKTCPDGSQPDSSGNCPSNQPQPSNPSGPSSANNPPSNNNPPPTNNNPPPTTSNNPSSGNDNGNNNGGGSGGSSSSGGSGGNEGNANGRNG